MRALRRAPLIIAVGFIDELASALPSAGAPDVRDTFAGTSGVDLAWLAAALLGLPTISGIVLEAPLLAASDRWARKHLVLAAALAVMAAAFGLASVSTSLVGVSCALAVAFPACGLAGALAEASLVGGCDSDAQRARAMTRWTLAGALGDTLGPIVLALALGWRAGSVVIAAIIASFALLIVIARPPVASASDDDGDGDGDGDATERLPRTSVAREVWSALRRPTVAWWLLATALCSLLDETLIAFAALHWDALADANGYGRFAIGALLAAFSIGGALSLVTIDLVIARHPRSTGRLLAFASAACALSYSAWLLVTGPYLGTAAFFLVGAFTAPLWALTQARVYDLFPGRPGLAGAASTVFSPIDVVIPIALGFVADRAGVIAALALLLVQPTGILALLALQWSVARSVRK